LTNVFVAPYSGNFKVIITNTTGCSVETACMPVNINCIPSFSQQSINLCQGDSVQLGNEWFSISGIYTDTLISVGGCDSLVTLNVNEILIDNSILVSTDTIFANSGYSNYEWIDCSTGTTVSNNDIHFFTIPYSGSFNVKITDMNGCSVESSCIPFILTETTKAKSESYIKLIPNPANSYVELVFGANFGNTIIELIDLNGKILQAVTTSNSTTIFSLNEVAAGVYYFKVYEGEKLTTIKKLVVVK